MFKETLYYNEMSEWAEWENWFQRRFLHSITFSFTYTIHLLNIFTNIENQEMQKVLSLTFLICARSLEEQITFGFVLKFCF